MKKIIVFRQSMVMQHQLHQTQKSLYHSSYIYDDLVDVGKEEMTIHKWSELWIRYYNETFLQNDLEWLKASLKHYILPKIGYLEYSDLTFDIYLDLLIKPVIKEYDIHTAQELHNLFMVITESAVKKEIMNKNKLSKITFDKKIG